MFDLSGRTALVTGASGGIGRAIAIALAGQGAMVALSGTRVAALAAVAETICAEAKSAETKSDRARVIAADLGDPGGAAALIEGCQAQLGGIDILVCNAGITRDGLAMRLSDADWDAVLAVNLSANFRLIRTVLRTMMKKRWGRIIGISSVVGTTGNAGQANYAASKAGLEGMLKAIARETASRGITANCIAPGFIETEMTEALPAAHKEAALASVPCGRAGRPEDVASCAVFLASDEAAYITGQTVHVNGGMIMV